ncbi:NAD(P)H-dependent oxidoreductase [Thermocrinis minervae]|uniref:NAD(P)H dehydrogenase (Quinone) n=1 Tax=Thermocrinis minervae TaxID=381751 RepID=A0A1M6QDK2_9AQUI|nr:NAD(P)H-dependent oxidoreductase [Thermocrinis minervae]SHK18322.1 NAD(P)H dehydrogenase (quinone) [Thermocrinis minervae]
MKALVIYAHPNPKSFNHAILERVQKTLESLGVEYMVRDLYSVGFNPVLSAEDFISLQQGKVLEDVKREQDYIRSSDFLIFIFPMWWYSFPAILKGYIDRVFSYGFAYEERDSGLVGLLGDKKALFFVTLGGSQEDYKDFAQCLKQTFSATLGFCGVDVKGVEFFYSVPYVSDEERKGYLNKVEEVLKNLLK